MKDNEVHCREPAKAISLPTSSEPSALNLNGCTDSRPAMMAYRAYTVGLEGRFVHYEVLNCSSDAEAITETRSRIYNHNVELWSGERLVARLNAG